MKNTNWMTRVLRFVWGIIPWMMVALVVVFILVMYGQIKKEKARQAEAKKAAMHKAVPAIRVITLTLKQQRLEDKINLPAQVEAYEDLLLKAEVRGQVVRLLIQEGETVEKEQVLVELDDRDYRTRLSRIEANYQLAKVDYERTAALAQKKVLSVSELDNMGARLKDLEAQVTEAKLALSRTKIVAPITGMVNEIKAKLGNFIEVGDPVAQILHFDKVKVTVGVPESDVAAIFGLNEAEVIIEALGKRRVKGKKVFLSRQPTTLARLYDLELMVRNPDGCILPGMFARVELVKKVFKGALAVPLYAIITQGDERFVFIEKDGRANRRNVELGMLVDWEVQVTSGLRAGERVIVVGHRFLNNGQPVEIIKNVSNSREIL